MIVLVVALLAVVAGGPRAAEVEALPTAPTVTPETLARPEQCRADLLVDIRLPGPARLEPTALALQEAGFPAVFLVRPASLDGYEHAVELSVAAGHEFGLLLERPGKAGAAGSRAERTSQWSRIHQDRRSLKRVSGKTPRAVGVHSSSPGLEGALEALSFTLILPAPGAAAEAPRRVVDLQGYRGTAVVLTALEPDRDRQDADDMGASLAALLDRTAIALGAGDQPVVRLSLPPEIASAGLVPLLARWREEVLLPCGASVISSREAEVAARAWLRSRTSGWGAILGARPEPEPPEPVIPPSVIERSVVRTAAQALPCDAPGATLPRTLPGDIALTEVFAALAWSLANPESDTIQVTALRAPQTSPRSVLGPEGARLEGALLKHAVGELTLRPGDQIPAFLRIGEHALTAAELLCAMAGVVDGQEAVLIHTTYNPDPYAPGLGWGGT